jgi:DNA polymerase
MKILWGDTETRSHCDLTSTGAYNYAQDRTTEIVLFNWAFDDEDVDEWWPTCGRPFPERVKRHITDGGQMRFHNAAFDRLIFSYVLCPDFDVPEPRLEQFYCTAAQARANCGPGSLEDVGRFAGASMKKDHRGKQLIRQLCIPPFNTDPKLFDEFRLYGAQDVRAMRAVSKAMRELSDEELADYHVNERINDRGVLVDVALCRAAIQYAEQELVEIEQTVREVTQGVITSVRSPKMRSWVEHRVGPQARKLMTVYKDGEAKVSIDKTVRGNLLSLADENPDEVPPDVAEVIQCADDLWASSVAKFARAAALADTEDGRVRGAFVFAGGAATGRASSYGLQVHNFPRKCAEAPDDVRQAMVRGHQVVPAFGRRVTDVLKGMLRPALLPRPGQVLIAADWSAIEARVNPWLSKSNSGAEKLGIFERGEDVYKVNAAATFRVAVEDVTKDQRQVGKVQELACLSEDTLVLTACGEKRIQDVLPGDLVWDGINWVRTDGPIYKGERHVIEYDGLCATPDHLVWVEGSPDPVELGWAAANGMRLAQVWSRSEVAAPIVGQAAVGGETAVREPEIAGVFDVRRQGREVCVPYGSRRVHLGFGEPWAAPRGHGDGPHRQPWGLRAGELTLVHQSAEPPAHIEDGEHCGVSSLSPDISAHQVRRQHVKEPAVDGVDVRADRRAVEQPKLQAKRRVWDLLNCGPLHRFTAQGRLVHNCGFAGGVGAFAAMGRIYGINLPESEARRMVDAWRRANSWSVPFWQGLEEAYTRAMRNRGHEFSAGRITYLFDGQHLWYALPSGRVLGYPFARLEPEGVT